MKVVYLRKAFSEVIFGSVDVLPVYGFLKTYFMTVTNMKHYVALDDADFRYNYRDNMTAQFKQDLYNKSFSHQDQDKHDDGLQKTLVFGLFMLLTWEDKYHIMFMNMIITILDDVISFEGQST